jgi:hypothetical protein
VISACGRLRDKITSEAVPSKKKVEGNKSAFRTEKG